MVNLHQRHNLHSSFCVTFPRWKYHKISFLLLIFFYPSLHPQPLKVKNEAEVRNATWQNAECSQRSQSIVEWVIERNEFGLGFVSTWNSPIPPLNSALLLTFPLFGLALVHNLFLADGLVLNFSWKKHLFFFSFLNILSLSPCLSDTKLFLNFLCFLFNNLLYLSFLSGH